MSKKLLPTFFVKLVCFEKKTKKKGKRAMRINQIGSLVDSLKRKELKGIWLRTKAITQKMKEIEATMRCFYKHDGDKNTS